MGGRTPKRPQGPPQPYIEKMEREIRQLEEQNLETTRMVAAIINVYLRTCNEIRRDERREAAKLAKEHQRKEDHSKDGKPDPGTGSSAA